MDETRDPRRERIFPKFSIKNADDIFNPKIETKVGRRNSEFQGGGVCGFFFSDLPAFVRSHRRLVLKNI